MAGISIWDGRKNIYPGLHPGSPAGNPRGNHAILARSTAGKLSDPDGWLQNRGGSRKNLAIQAEIGRGNAARTKSHIEKSRSYITGRASGGGTSHPPPARVRKPLRPARRP